MAIDPKKARAALEREFKDLSPSDFRERLDRSIPSWASPTKKNAKKPTKQARVKAPPRLSAPESKTSAKKK